MVRVARTIQEVEMQNFYHCDYCGAIFSRPWDCQEHERTHIHDHSTWTNEQLATWLERLKDYVNRYSTIEAVAGVPAEDFMDLVQTAADRLRQAQEESEETNDNTQEERRLPREV